MPCIKKKKSTYEQRIYVYFFFVTLSYASKVIEFLIYVVDTSGDVVICIYGGDPSGNVVVSL